MGCSHSLNKSTSSSNLYSLSSSTEAERVLWYDIRNYNFDTKNFGLLVTFQNTHCDSKGKMISPFLASIVALELKRFFFLCALCVQDTKKLDHTKQLPDVSDLIPSPLVDRLWKLLITNTEAYELFSLSMFDFKLQRDSQKFNQIDNYKRTRQMLAFIFGPPNPMIWPDYPSAPVLQLAHQGFVLMENELVYSFYEYMVLKISKTKRPVVFTINKLEQIRRKQATRNFPNYAESGSLSENTHKIIETDQTQDDSEVSAKFVGFKEMAPLPNKLMLLMNEDKIDNLTSKLNSLKLEESKEPACNEKQIPSLNLSKLDNQEELHEQAEFLLSQMDLHPISDYVIKTFSNEVCVPLHIAEAIFTEYKKFLILYYLGSNSSRFIYPPLIKRAWDYHLAQTADYDSFSLLVFKEFLNPPLLPRKITASEMHDYDETLLAYQNLYETTPPENIWISSALRFIAEDRVFMHVGCFIHENQSESELLNFYGLKEVEKAASEMETLAEAFV